MIVSQFQNIYEKSQNSDAKNSLLRPIADRTASKLCAGVRVERPDSSQTFEVDLELKGRAYFPLFLRGPDSPLRWRELLVFSAAAYLARRRGEITQLRLEEKSRLCRQSISRIVKSLQEHTLLANDLRPTEPGVPSRFFNLKRKTPVQDRWTDKLVYTRYYIPNQRARNGDAGLEPHDSCLLGWLYYKQPTTTSVAYLAAATGIDRKQIRTSLKRLLDLEFTRTRRNEAGLLAVEYFYPEQAPTLFRKTKKKSNQSHNNLDGVATCLIQVYKEGLIPYSYLHALTPALDHWEYVYPAYWLEIVRECSHIHQSWKKKGGPPFPSKKMILVAINKRHNSRRT
jgi:DNA-binding MarR family transcriptional regulator